MNGQEERVADMNEMQRFLVADHIARLEEDAAALRSDRTRHSETRTSTSRRLRARLGQLLVSVGVVVAGAPAVATTSRAADSMAPQKRDVTIESAGCEDAPPLSRAA